jgi:LysM repeat protein
VAEQRINEPVRPQAQTPARQPAAAPQATPQARPAPAQSEVGYITLQPGETLSYISALYAVPEKDLIAWNGLSSPHDIRAGQRLAVRPPGMHGTPPAQQAETAPDGFIIVASGQSLSGIAQRYGVTVAQLREWNGLTSDAIRIGQRLRVQPPTTRASGAIGTHSVTPNAPDADGMITVQPGQTLSAIAARHKVSTADLRKWNRLQNDRLQSGQKLRVKAPVRVHTVREGESLNGIAAKYKVSAKALMQKTQLSNADMLPLGKELIIP